jgi:hypothetical protein
LRIFLFQVFVDDRGFVDDGVAIYQYGNFAVGVSFKQLFRLVFEIAFDELVGYLFFRQDKPCPVSVRSGTIRKQPHKFTSSFVVCFYHLSLTMATP